jgi:hypothetical protein
MQPQSELRTEDTVCANPTLSRLGGCGTHHAPALLSELAAVRVKRAALTLSRCLTAHLHLLPATDAVSAQTIGGT